MKTNPRLAVVTTGAIDINILDEINRQRRIANVIMLAVIGANKSGNDDGIEDICELHIEALRGIAASLRPRKTA